MRRTEPTLPASHTFFSLKMFSLINIFSICIYRDVGSVTSLCHSNGCSVGRSVRRGHNFLNVRREVALPSSSSKIPSPSLCSLIPIKRLCMLTLVKESFPLLLSDPLRSSTYLAVDSSSLCYDNHVNTNE